MKKGYAGHLVISLFLLTAFTGLQAQKKIYEPPEEGHTFMLVGYGGGGSIFSGEPAIAGGLGLQYNFKKQFIQLRFSGISEIGLFNSDYRDVMDYSLLAGLQQRKGKWKLSVAAGPGLSQYSQNINTGGGGLFDPPGSKPDYRRKSQYAVGFSMQAGVLYQPRKFGIGVQLNSNINELRSGVSAGIMYAFRF